MGKKNGRPKIEWSDNEFDELEKLVGIQCTAEEISNIKGIDEDTLNRLIKDHYGPEIKTFSDFYKKYSSGGKASLRRTQFNLSKTSAAMAIWLGKQYLGQKDLYETDITQRDNKVEISFVDNSAKDE